MTPDDIDATMREDQVQSLWTRIDDLETRLRKIAEIARLMSGAKAEEILELAEMPNQQLTSGSKRP